MSKSIWIIVIILVLGVVGFLLVAKAPQTPTTTAPITTVSVPVTQPTTAPTSALPVKELQIQGFEYAYSLKSIEAAPGQNVRITFKNTGNMGHNFVIDGIVAGPIIDPGQETVITFVAPKKIGNYAYYCSVGSHRSLGMAGQLVVK